MIDFGGIQYYIDLNKISSIVLSESTKPVENISVVDTTTTTDVSGEMTTTTTKQTVSNVAKEIENMRYDVIKTMIEVLVDNDDELDDSLGTDRALATTTLGYKLAFNTLYQCGILKAKE